MAHTILRLPAVIAGSGLSRSTIYRFVGLGLWTKPIPLGFRAVGWPAHELDALNTARTAGKSNDEVRALVASLEAARRDAA